KVPAGRRTAATAGDSAAAVNGNRKKKETRLPLQVKNIPVDKGRFRGNVNTKHKPPEQTAATRR
ncbi:hypothetical protein, partial [uncultured Alistipes sp.]